MARVKAYFPNALGLAISVCLLSLGCFTPAYSAGQSGRYLIKFSTTLEHISISLRWKNPAGRTRSPVLRLSKGKVVSKLMSIYGDPKPEIKITNIENLKNGLSDNNVMCGIVLDIQKKIKPKQVRKKKTLPKEIKVINYLPNTKNPKQNSKEDIRAKQALAKVQLPGEVKIINYNPKTQKRKNKQLAPPIEYSIIFVKQNFFGQERYGCIVTH